MTPATPPTIILRTDAIEEANRQNTINQSIIGAKEGVTKAIKTIVSSDIIDVVLYTADGSDRRN